MITAPANWDALWGADGTVMEVALALGGKTYGNADIASGSLKLTHQLYQSFGTGNACAAKLAVTLITGDAMPEGAAKATLKVRLKGASLSTSWVDQGTYYLDTAEATESGTVKLTLYDGLALADRYLYADGKVPESESYPRNALTMANAICTLLGLTLDASNKALWQSVSCTAPEGLTCRQVLQSIAAAAGGNWTMTKAGRLHFQPLADRRTDLSSGLVATASVFTVQSTQKTVLVASLRNGEEAFSRGSGGYEVASQCAFASDDNVARAYAAVNGKQYLGIKASGVHVTPLMELGDRIGVNGAAEDLHADSVSLVYQQGCWGDVESPLKDEVEQRLSAVDRQARLDRIAKYAALIDELDQTITSGEIFDAILDKLNAKANETGGWFYYVEGKGVRTYDKKVSDPAVGAEATQVVEIKGGNIRIANSKKNGEWQWRTILTSGLIASDVLTANNLVVGTIGNYPSGNYWNLDTGQVHLATNTAVGDNGTTVADIIAASEDAVNAVGDVGLLKAGSTNGVDVQYGISASAGAHPTDWKTTAKALWNQKGKFLWTRQKITMFDGKVKYSTPRLLSDGTQLVKEIREQYYLSTSKQAPSGGSWSDKQQAYVNGRYYWTRNRIERVDGTVGYEPSATGELAQAFTTVTDVYDSSRLTQKAVFNKLTNNGKVQGLFTDASGNLFVNGSYISTGVISDRAGKNWWNLQTGELRMQSVLNVEEKLAKKAVGGANLLNGTGEWVGWTKRGSITVSSGQASMPAQSADWGVSLISPLASVQFANVKNREVTVSFDMKCSSEWGAVADKNAVWVVLGTHTSTSRSRLRWRSIRVQQAPTTSWQRVSFTTAALTAAYFTGGSGSTSDTTLVGLEVYNRSSKALQIRRVKMEVGNTPTDWLGTAYDAQLDATTKANKALSDANANATTKANKALSDAKTYAAAQVKATKTEAYAESKRYADAISAKDRSYTDAQKRDLDNSLTQAKVLNRLTNNGAAKGVYISDGQLYINATYMKTGTLNASVIKAGVIAPSSTSKGSFTMNMATGYIKAQNMELVNMNATGTVQTGSGTCKMQLSDGQLRGYRGSTRVGFIDSTAHVWWIDQAKYVDGLQMQANGILRISSPLISVARTSNAATTTTNAFSGKVTLKNLTFGMNSNMTSCKVGSVTLEFINGLLVSHSKPSGM